MVDARGLRKVGADMNRRNGTTLVEVLVAIFIMGIGLLAILSLFPLGAVQMAQALKDQRAAEAAANSAAYARVIWKQACDADVTATGAQNNPPFREAITGRQYPRSIQRFVYAMDDPNFNDQSGTTPNPSSYPPPAPQIPPGGFALPAGGPGAGATFLTDMVPMPLTGPNANRSSYPVLIDMFGWQANQSVGGDRQWWVGQAMQQGPHNKVGMIPRRPLFIRHPQSTTLPPSVPPWQVLGLASPAPDWNWNTSQRLLKQFSLFDDMTFTDDGRVANSNGTPADSSGRIERQGRYSWAYLFRRVRNVDQRYQADISLIVYSGRSIDVPTDENSFQALGTTDSRSVQLVYAPGNKPAIKRGYWLLDATIFDSAGSVFPQGFFYRAVNVEDGPPVGSNQSLIVELQTPLRFGPNAPNPRIFVVMSNVVEVFQIGEVTQTKSPRLFTDDQDY
jgi:prepilin-type N-terminal cleavage/methylation domain-containing protein